ncbi:hypothetical protein [uncultured Dietzia sp.]|nr:hypothetical protein [uncultured Dietzia sp.]
MTSIENILGTVAKVLGSVLGVGVGSLANITEAISGISEGGSPDPS